MPGPLAGLKIIEMEAIGPVPYCGMLLGDLGADILRVERPGGTTNGMPRKREYDLPLRNRSIAVLDMKSEGASDRLLALIDKADVVLEGYRPGVMERLGLGPDICLARNPRLVFGRMTGWGQDGPRAKEAGHDINYIALAGALSLIGRADAAPTPPLNLVGDYGGGSLFLAFGVLAALFERQQSGKGQVVDAAIVDGTASLLASFSGLLAQGVVREERGSNYLDSGAPFYDSYPCADGGWLSLGPIEGKFYALTLEKLGIAPDEIGDQNDKGNWPKMRALFAERIAGKTRAEWTEIFFGSDCCVAPVNSLSEASKDPHIAARKTFVEVDGVTQPAPAPRFSRSKPDAIRPPVAANDRPFEEQAADWLARR